MSLPSSRRAVSGLLPHDAVVPASKLADAKLQAAPRVEQPPRRRVRDAHDTAHVNSSRCFQARSAALKIPHSHTTTYSRVRVDTCCKHTHTQSIVRTRTVTVYRIKMSRWHGGGGVDSERREEELIKKGEDGALQDNSSSSRRREAASDSRR